jgi:hypothetical protein
MVALAAGDLRGILLRAMPGLNMLQPGGNGLEIVVATLTALLVAYFLLYFKFFRQFLMLGARVKSSARLKGA